MNIHLLPYYSIFLVLIPFSGCIRESSAPISDAVSIPINDLSIDTDQFIQDSLMDMMGFEMANLPDNNELNDQTLVDMSNQSLIDMSNQDSVDMSNQNGTEEMCIPYNDQCSEGRYCQYQNEQLLCIESEGIELDGTGNTPLCINNRCGRGLVCLNPEWVGDFAGEPRCYQPCAPEFIDQAGAECSDELGCCLVGRHTCFPVISETGDSLSFGACHY